MEMQEFDQHLCCQRKPVTQAKKNHINFVFYDFETTQNENHLFSHEDFSLSRPLVSVLLACLW
jgi:hypothetical protein